MPNYLLATDPRGYKVECSDQRFEYLLYKHEESADLLNEAIIKEAIEEPKDNEIFRSGKKSKENFHIYYKDIEERKAEVRVIVKYDPDSFGELITFHLCSRRPPNEETIWKDQ